MKLDKFKKNLSTIILCGGKGKRLLPLTKSTPKPLIKIKNKEILFCTYSFSSIVCGHPHGVVAAPPASPHKIQNQSET